MENSTQIQFIQTFGQDGPIGIIDVDTAVQFSINFAVQNFVNLKVVLDRRMKKKKNT